MLLLERWLSFAFVLTRNLRTAIEDYFQATPDVLIMVPLALKSNEILPFSFLLLWSCC